MYRGNKKEDVSLPSSKTLIFWLCVGLLFFLFIYSIRSILLPFVLGIMIAYFLDPAADKLEKLKLSRTMATATITLTFFVILILLILLIVPTVIEQLSGFILDFPTYFTSLETKYEKELASWFSMVPKSYIEGMKTAAANISGFMMKIVGGILGGLFYSGMSVINMLSLILITPVVAFYMLRDWDIIKHEFYALLPRKHEKTIREQLALIDATLAGFIRGQLNVCFILAVFYAFGLLLTGLKFGILIGIATGFLVIIPYLGLLFGMGLGLTVAFFQFDSWDKILSVLAVFVIGQIIEGNFITPKLVGEKVGLHPVWIIFGLLAGAALFGFVGVLLAVPVTAVIGVLIRFALSRYLESSYYSGAS